MARNKHPEETIEKIVQVSAKLFLQQGYENTSIQDMLNQLGGLSKGAIYHHFRAKEEILIAVMNYIYRDTEIRATTILKDKSLNGLQRLRQLFNKNTADISQVDAFSMGLNMMDSPRLLVMQLRSTIEETARLLIYPVVQEGIADGSLAGLLYPEEFTEAFLLLTNVWINPMVYAATPETIERKFRFLQHMTQSLGISESLIPEEAIAHLIQYTTLHNEAVARAQAVSNPNAHG